MSRSRRKTPVSGITTARSEKQDKRIYNRRFRHTFKQHLRIDVDNDVWPQLREYSNVWSMAKDGKSRFDPYRYPHRMRK